MSRNTPLYTRGEERRSVYNYAADSYEPPQYTHYYLPYRTRSVSREPSVARTLRAHSIAPSSYRLYASSVEKELVICEAK